MTTKEEFKKQREAVRQLKDHAKSATIREHAARLWQAMEGAVNDPDNAPREVKKAIDGCRRRLEEALKAGKGEQP